MNTNVNILCYRSKTLSNGEHSLVIRVCKDEKKKYQSLGISVNLLIGISRRISPRATKLGG